ncbi:MAG: hypothetical protein WD651_06580 [Acidimicrobiia bacterium]
MDRDFYERWHQHPLRRLLNQVANSKKPAVIHGDTLADLKLPARQGKALREAMAQIEATSGERRNQMADRLSAEILESLPGDYESREEQDSRRAEEGDPQALAAVKARAEATEEMADRVYRRARGQL